MKQGKPRRTKFVEHLVTFVFKYRPLGEFCINRSHCFSINISCCALDVLQADGIAPKDTPTAVQPEASKDEDAAESSGSLAARKRLLMVRMDQVKKFLVDDLCA